MTVIKYVGHTGAEFILDGDANIGVGMERGEILDWEYSVQELGGSVDCLYRGARTFDGEFFIGYDGDLTASDRLDALARIVARDNASGEFGRIYAGDWFMPVLMVGLAKRYSDRDAVFDCTGRFRSDSPRWMRMREVQFRSREDVEGFDYPHDYSHDYSPSWFSGAVLNASPLSCAVRICIQGPASGWHVRIADNVYSCSKDLDAGELLLIDGLTEEIWYTDKLRNKFNAFSTWGGVFKEGSGSFVFERVPSGQSPLFWDGCDALSITLCEESDEWLWGSVL